MIKKLNEAQLEELKGLVEFDEDESISLIKLYKKANWSFIDIARLFCFSYDFLNSISNEYKYLNEFLNEFSNDSSKLNEYIDQIDNSTAYGNYIYSNKVKVIINKKRDEFVSFINFVFKHIYRVDES